MAMITNHNELRNSTTLVEIINEITNNEMKRNSTSYCCYLCVVTNSALFECWNLCVASCPVKMNKQRDTHVSSACNSTAVWKNWAKFMRWQTDESCKRISCHFTRKQILSAATANCNFVRLCSARCAWFLFGFSLFYPPTNDLSQNQSKKSRTIFVFKIPIAADK